MSSTTPTTHTAHKRHVCDWCGELIEPTNRYVRWRYFHGDYTSTVKAHAECHAAVLHGAQIGQEVWYDREGERGVFGPK